MILKKTGLLILIFLCLALMKACIKEGGLFNPSINLEVNTTKGLTTDIFTIKIKPLEPIPSNEKLHCRWDWEGDAIFDTRFSDDLEVVHRFYKPGIYYVRCEVLSLSGRKCVDGIQFEIEQGFSSPRPKISAKPETGHFLTNFIFDASETTDDEDSLKTIKFRWDFEDDGLWDTPYLNEPIVSHPFNEQGNFNVVLEALDPSNRTATTSLLIKLHNTDTCIVPNFTWSSETGRVGDYFCFDASSTYHQQNTVPQLIYKWMFPDQQYTDGSEEPIIIHQFNFPGKKTITLLVEDQNGLQNKIEKELFVSVENVPPKAKILTPTQYGNVETLFYLNAWESIDDHTPPTKILLRWDYDGDGNWDTNKTEEKEFYHQYSHEGIYNCILEAEDEEGLTDTTSLIFEVSSCNYPTSWFKDKRDNKLYGTVKIGDQWWMSENLDFRLDPKKDLTLIQRCFDDNPANCDKYGSLYAIFPTAAMLARGGSLCPSGWHIPSKSEMNTLIENIETPNGMENLRPSGSSGFNALFSGNILYDFIIDNITEEILDTVYFHNNLNFSTNFLTTSHRPNRVPHTVYTLQIQSNYSKLYPMEADMEGFYSLRCIKD